MRRPIAAAQRLATYVGDINAAREAEARSAGAIVCTSAQELATHCDIVITLVVDDQQTDEVLFGASVGGTRRNTANVAQALRQCEVLGRDGQ